MHGNKAAKRHSGSPPTEKMVRECRRQVEEIQTFGKSKHTFYTYIAKWPDVEAEVKKSWITDHRDRGVFVSSKNDYF
jgi:hypothetical protein